MHNPPVINNLPIAKFYKNPTTTYADHKEIDKQTNGSQRQNPHDMTLHEWIATTAARW